MRAKAFKIIKLLQEFGPYLREPHSKKMKGSKKIFELRVKQGSDIVRIFYFHHMDGIYILTSGFIKKQNKTDKSEIKKAEIIMAEFLRGKNDGK